jgi:DNA polymerase-3 subunit epsilon
MVLLDNTLTERASVSLIIKPEGWEIPDEVAAIHGITTEMATALGVPEKQAVNLYMSLLYGTGAKVLAHNSAFDLRIMRIAMLRAGRTKEWLDANPVEDICTMKTALPILNLAPTPKMLAAGFNKPKQPNLGECIQHFFGETLEGAHDALVDVRACLRIYRHLNAPTVEEVGDVV